MRRCSIGSDGPVMSSLTNARSTNTIASTSRMLARNLLPRPSPLLAPSTRPPMSTTCTAACTTFFDFDITARRSRRSSGTLATPMFGSLVANAYGAASAPPPVRALYSELFPALGRPTRPKRSMRPTTLPAWLGTVLPMRWGLSISLSEELADPSVIADVAVTAETNGWDGIFVWDHLWNHTLEPFADPWITLA